MGDEEILGPGETRLDLDADGIAARDLGKHIESGIVERLLLWSAAQTRLGIEHEIDAAPLDLLGRDGV